MFKKILIASGLLSLMLGGFQNCSDVDFTKAEETAASDGETGELGGEECTDPETTSKKIKFIFMVDSSGSTGDSDPDRSIRTSSINRFLEAYGNRNNFRYVFDVFGGTIRHYSNLTFNFEEGMQSKFKNANFMEDANDEFLYLANSWTGTKFSVAVDAIEDTIINDGGKSKYVVILMSDGKPESDTGLESYDYSGGFKYVDKKLGHFKENDQLVFNTVYFCKDDTCSGSSATTARSILKGMKDAGGGNFIDATVPEDIVIEDLVNDPTNDCD